MTRLIPRSPHSTLRVFTSCLLSFMLLMTPLATLAASLKSATPLKSAHASTEKAALPVTESTAVAESAKVEHVSSSPGLFNMFAPAPLPVGTVTATLKDIFTDADGDGKADKGQTITYEAVITNSTGASITGTTFTDTPDANTTLDPNTVHASPVAFDDTYNWVGNTVLDTSARSLSSIISNDTISTAPDTIVLNTTPASGPSHGSVTISANGHFVYTPAVGYTGDDSFTYTISNSADNTLVGTGTVTIHMPNRIWYLQGGAPAAGDGRSNTPSNDPAAISGLANSATDVFYVFSSGTTLNGPFTLNDSQQLLGQGVALNLAGFGQLFAAGSTPTIGTTVAATNSVTLGSGNTLSGFNIGTTTGTAITGSSVGALNISLVSINTTGGGLDLTGVGSPTVSISLGGLTSSGGAKNVNLVGLNGTISLASGALSGSTAGASNHAFAVSGGNATVTYSGTITKATNGNVVNISSHTGNAITLSGNINGNGSSGISFSSNSGGTVDLTGTITLNSGGINATNNTGGTFNFTNATKTLNTTGTTAVNL
ncbi:MAG TPA: Ig-like domain-containing protein, partial [Pyrinomonadaceae bacterium]|nr:Ig-like domain-containing protein [Pyrinomonadaceae bacterium]